MSKAGIEGLMDAADIYFENEKFEQALRSYRKILETRTDLTPDAQIGLIDKLTICLYNTEQYSKAPEELERFESRFERGSVPYARLQNLKADVYLNLGYFDMALESGNLAFEILKPTGEMKTFAATQLILGSVYLLKGDLQNARRFIEGALYTYRRLSDETGILYSMNKLACLYDIKSRWHQAIEHWKQALNMSEESGREEWVASLSLNLGMTYARTGDWSLAAEYLLSGTNAAEKLGHILGAVRGRISLASLARIQRRWDDALQLLEKCRKLCEKEGYRREACLCHEGLGELAFDRHDYNEADQHYSNALEIAEEIAPEGDMAVEIHRRLADLSVALNKPEEALKQADSALRIAKKLGDRFEEACSHRARALAYQELGEPEQAHQLFAQTIQLLEELREKYERARTLLELGKFIRSEKNIDDAVHHMLKAEELFSTLPSQYWIAVSQLEVARAKLDKEDLDSAIAYVNRAQKLLEKTGENEVVDRASKLRKTVESKMIQSALLAVSDYSAPEGNLNEIIENLVDDLKVERSFLALNGNTDFQIGNLHNIGKVEAKRLFTSLNGSRLNKPMISTNLHLDRKFSHLQTDGILSFMFIPFGHSTTRGVLYVDKRSSFTQGDLLSSVRFTKELTLRITEMRQEELTKENLRMQKELRKKGYPEIVTRNRGMFEIFDLIDKMKDESTPVLIEGETGTGKELVARALHYKGRRGSKPFVPVDCSTLTKTLAASEFFGHKKGSFTDAVDDKCGLFEQANGGTLFLDEVSNLSKNVQAKLLRVLQEGRVRRIGGSRERKVNVRVIAASNTDIKKEMAEGKFRKDLYYRLKGITIHLPPLRERKEDIPLLAHHFVENFCRENKRKVKEITEPAMRVLVLHDWGGNVRELQNEIHRAVVLAEDGRVTPDLFSFSTRQSIPKTHADYDLQDLIRALERNNWVKRRTARMLDIPESTLRKRLKSHGVTGPSDVRKIGAHV